MISFITSSFINNRIIDSSNGFVENLGVYWKKDSHFLHFASDPEDYEMADQVSEDMFTAFNNAGLTIAEIKTFDARYIKNYANRNGVSQEAAAFLALKEALAWADVFYLAGGHCPTEHTFLEKCKAREALGIEGNEPDFDGIFLSLSAGSINSAKEAYLIPELPGESIDSDFVRFAPGLGITELQIVPHWQYMKNQELDGKPFVKGVLENDSLNRSLYLLPDGSYFIIKDGFAELFGEAEVMENKTIRSLNPGMIYSESPVFSDLNLVKKGQINRFLDRLIFGNYDMILSVDEDSKNLNFFYISTYYQKKGFSQIFLKKYEDLINFYIQNLLVKEEADIMKTDMDFPRILWEIRRDGEFVRTAHIDTEAGIQAQKITFRLMEDFKPGKSKLLITFVNIASIVDHDWMTDVYSRTGFLREASRILPSLIKIKKTAIVYTNIVGFKAINDIFGTNGGDMAIFQQRDILRSCLKPMLIAHYEADHFVLLTDIKHLTAENLNKLSNQIYTDGFKEYQFNIHCGVYLVADDSQELNYMIDRAKLAEQVISGNLGQTYAFYDDEMGAKYLEQKTYASELDKALDNHEIKTYFQPVVDAKNHKIISAEALVRWKHPDKGMIPPNCFVPAFEQDGQISKVDYRMLSNVLAFNQKRKEKGLSMIPCAVNLSRVDFYDIKIINNIKKLLKEYQDLPNMLKFEVTESAYMDLEANAVNFLSDIRKLGMSVLLDDYGSGMSSIATLESFDFDILKLDMSFTFKIGKSKKAEAIIKSTIEMAHGVGAKVVAEGVETKEQLDFLCNADCDYIQGYYFYKPMSEEEFSKILDK